MHHYEDSMRNNFPDENSQRARKIQCQIYYGNFLLGGTNYILWRGRKMTCKNGMTRNTN